MENILAKNYAPKEFEDRLYESWEESGAFGAIVDQDKKPYTIVMPPPNITGQLHMGHAFDHTLQDVLIRWKRMMGYNALWIPGSDHASIATEVKVADKIREEEGKTKEDLGREEFLRRAWEWKDTYGGKITRQIRRLGNSCDWSRERFTMDAGCNAAVTESFVRLYEKGLIYRGNRLINWCPSCGTSLSDAEVEHEEKTGKYYYINYPAVGGGSGIVVATSRPETMFGDTAVAVHPDDERYKDFVGKKVILPIVNIEIPVIADEYPDPEKGTGAVKITPAHDPNDFEVGERHQLGKPTCINLDATMNALAGKYEGLDRYACRKALLKELDEKGYLIKTEDKEIAIGACYRCDTVIEPMLSDQWFVSMHELAEPAIEKALSKELQHIPDRFEKTYLHWLTNIRDWCISRQLWWGHRIPAYYCQDCGEIVVARVAPVICPRCGSSRIKQDEDVLDTWFSSALWPFSTLGWPEKTEDLDYFYPTDVLVTGYDIIFFWVVRMVFSGLEMTGELPFKYVYVHGLVRDAEGRKMSKSLGNGVDPIEVIDQYGADALRFMLMTGVSPGNDLKFQIDKVEASRNFANKLWNASRFVLMTLGDDAEILAAMSLGNLPMAERGLLDEDKWMLSQLNCCVQEITTNLEKFDLSLAAQKIYELIWNTYCDWYIELVKARLYGSDEKDKAVARYNLVIVLKDMLKMLHPFMPFITEEIWSYLPKAVSTISIESNEAQENRKIDFLMRSQWPIYDAALAFPEETSKTELIMDMIRAIRNVRAEAEAAPSKKLKLMILSSGKELAFIQSGERHIKNLANIIEISYIQDKSQLPDEVMSSVISNVELFIPLDDLLDYQAEFERLSRESNKMKVEIQRIQDKLANQGFLAKAPAAIVEEEKAKCSNYEEMLAKISERLTMVGKKLV